MLFQKAFHLMFSLNRTGQESTVSWNYCCFLDEEHSAALTLQLLQAIPASQTEYVASHTEAYVFLFMLLNKPRQNTAQSQSVETVFWFGLVLLYSSRWQDTIGGTAPHGTGSSPFHVVQGSSKIFVSQSSSWEEEDYLKYRQRTLTTAMNKPRTCSFVSILLVFLRGPQF